MYEQKLLETKQRLAVVKGKVSLILDVWTSVNHFAFHGIIVQWIDEYWELQELILTLDILEGSHSGVKLAQSFVKVLEEFGLMNKIAAITSDNASNYDTFFQEVQRIFTERGLNFNEKDQRVRCLAHIVNLACQDALKVLKKQKSTTGTATGSEDPQSESDPEISGSESDNDSTLESNSIYMKLKTSIGKIRNSVLHRETLRRQCQAFGLKHNELVRDNSTRWNSTYHMLKRALKLRPSFETTLRSAKHLEKFILTEQDWEQVRGMLGLLKPFKKMTLNLEHKGIPTMSLSAMIYIQLYNHLESYSVIKHINFNIT